MPVAPRPFNIDDLESQTEESTITIQKLPPVVAKVRRLVNVKRQDARVRFFLPEGYATVVQFLRDLVFLISWTVSRLARRFLYRWVLLRS